MKYDKTLRTSCRKTKHGPKCPNYSYDLLRCKLGYVNPSGSIKQALGAVEQGLLKPCPLTQKGAVLIEMTMQKR